MLAYLFVRETSRREKLTQLALRALVHEYGSTDARKCLPHRLREASTTSHLIESSSHFPTPATRDVNSGWWEYYDSFKITTDLLLVLTSLRDTDLHSCDLGEPHTWCAELQELMDPVAQQLILYALLAESDEIGALLLDALPPHTRMLTQMRFALEDPRDVLIVVDTS